MGAQVATQENQIQKMVAAANLVNSGFTPSQVSQMMGDIPMQPNRLMDARQAAQEMNANYQLIDNVATDINKSRLSAIAPTTAPVPEPYQQENIKINSE
jgi:hypothetical protein